MATLATHEPSQLNIPDEPPSGLDGRALTALSRPPVPMLTRDVRST